jgi:hypothetical protein
MPRIATPAGLSDESEFPLRAFPNIPLWAENYCFVAYDPIREIGLWTHLGRAPFDPTLWRELTMVYLPTGERLINKSYGRTEHTRGPGGATLSHECIVPWNHWRSRRDGGSLRTTVKELDTGMAFDRAHERVAFDLTWDANSPVWNWGTVEDEHGWGKLHYEQLCRVRGSFTIAGKEIAFDGHGLRDHTSGPRDFTIFTSHIWAWANFPSGRGFILLTLLIDGNLIGRAVTYENGELVDQVLSNPPLLTDRSQADDSYVLELGPHRISAEILHPFPNGFDGPNDICLGYDPAVTTTANWESLSRFTWDGEVGYGHTERSLRAD